MATTTRQVRPVETEASDAMRPQAPPAWLEELKPEAGRNGMAELFGKWPGDSEEGLAEELRALRESKQRDLVVTSGKTNG